MKEQIKPSEKIQLSDEEIVNLSLQFKILVIRITQKWFSVVKNRGKSEGYEK